MILNTSGSFFQIKNNADSFVTSGPGKATAVDGSNEITLKLILADHTAAGDIDLTWGNDTSTSLDNGVGGGSLARPNRVYTVSLDPDNTKYIGKVLNTDPKKFQAEGHLLYLDWSVEHELAPVVTSAQGDTTDTVYLSTGSENQTNMNSTFAGAYSGTQWKHLFGWHNARYQAPKTTSFCLLYTSPSPRDLSTSRMPSSA